MAERSVEGRHSLISRIRKRAPRAGLPYISLELRFQHLQAMAATEPRALMRLQHQLQIMSSSEGFRKTVQYLCQQILFQTFCLSFGNCCLCFLMMLP